MSQVQPINLNETSIQSHEYFLRQYIYAATRYSVDFVYGTVQEDAKFSTVFEYYVKEARSFFESFKTSLKAELLQYDADRRHLYLHDIRERFFPMITKYLNWYEDHKEEAKKFDQYNPYELMYESIRSTEREILKYLGLYEENGLKDTSKSQRSLSNPKELKDIFRNENKFTRFLLLLKALHVIDESNRSLVQTGKEAGNLFAAIMFLKDSSDLLNDDHTEKELLEIFNSFLNTNFKKIKKNSKSFRDALEEAEGFYTELNKKEKLTPRL